MKHVRIAILAVLGLVINISVANAWGVIGPPPFNCTTTISDGGTINTNLIVPAGARCELDNVTVKGNVDVEAGATFITRPGANQTVTIGGNVTAGGCASVDLTAQDTVGNTAKVSIGNNVSITNCTGLVQLSGPSSGQGGITIGNNVVCSGNPVCKITRVAIGGHLTVDNNNMPGTQGNEIGNTQVTGNVDFSGNTGFGPAGNSMFNVVIGGNLKCVNKTPAAIVLSPNQVSGNTTGCPNPT